MIKNYFIISNYLTKQGQHYTIIIEIHYNCIGLRHYENVNVELNNHNHIINLIKDNFFLIM